MGRSALCGRCGSLGFEDAEEVAGDVALQAALDLAGCLAFGGAAGGVGAGGGVMLEAGEHDGVQRAVELSVAAAVEPEADGLPRAGGDRGGAAEHREGGVAAQPAGVRPGAVELGGGDRTDADLVEQRRDGALDEPFELAFEVVGFGFEGEHAAGGVAQRDHGCAVLVGVRRQRPQPAAAVNERVGVEVAQLVAQLFAGGHDQRLEVIDRLRSRQDGAATSDQQHADGFTVAAHPWLGEVLAVEGFVGGADGVELVGLRAVARRRAARPVDLDDALALLEQEGGQACAEAAA